MSFRGLHMSIRGVHMSIRGPRMSIRGARMSLRGVHMSIRGVHMSIRGGPILVPRTVPCARYRARGGRTPNWGPLLLLEGGVGRGGVKVE